MLFLLKLQEPKYKSFYHKVDYYCDDDDDVVDDDY